MASTAADMGTMPAAGGPGAATSTVTVTVPVTGGTPATATATATPAVPARPGTSVARGTTSPAGSAGPATPARAAAAAAAPNLRTDRRNAWAFAPLACPDRVTVEGRVRAQPAWSTSKVLVAAAFVQTVGRGDPARLTARQRGWVAQSLQRSDMSSLLAMSAAIPGGQARPMTAILRSIGDRTTVPPERRAGLMPWTIREQVRFAAALSAGRVVNRATSRYLLAAMRPMREHAWGLGRIGATAFKGGWLRGNTQTRQMGIVRGYAVAIITDAVGPAVRQSDGDSAHVTQMNQLATLLSARLAQEAPRACRG